MMQDLVLELVPHLANTDLSDSTARLTQRIPKTEHCQTRHGSNRHNDKNYFHHGLVGMLDNFWQAP